MKSMPRELKSKLRRLQILNAESKEISQEIEEIFQSYNIDSSVFRAEENGDMTIIYNKKTSDNIELSKKENIIVTIIACMITAAIVLPIVYGAYSISRMFDNNEIVNQYVKNSPAITETVDTVLYNPDSK